MNFRSNDTEVQLTGWMDIMLCERELQLHSQMMRMLYLLLVPYSHKPRNGRQSLKLSLERFEDSVGVRWRHLRQWVDTENGGSLNLWNFRLWTQCKYQWNCECSAIGISKVVCASQTELTWKQFLQRINQVNLTQEESSKLTPAVMDVMIWYIHITE